MKPLRSLLFVPGNKPDWMAKAAGSGADALILDLEDSVPVTAKATARPMVRRAIEELKGRGERVTLVVRVNDASTGLTSADLAEVVCPGLDGIVIAKLETADDVKEIDRLLLYSEGRAGLPAGHIEVIPILETAKAFRNAYDIATASPRVAALHAGSSPGGDVARSIGYHWSGTELETLYLRSKVVLDARAAGLRYVTTGFWPDIRDLEGVERHSTRNRQVGFTGEMMIHPSHAAIVNRVYTPTEDEIAYARGVLAAMADGERQGTAAVTYQGAMVDYAMVKTARQMLQFARDIGVYGGEV